MGIPRINGLLLSIYKGVQEDSRVINKVFEEKYISLDCRSTKCI